MGMAEDVQRKQDTLYVEVLNKQRRRAAKRHAKRSVEVVRMIAQSSLLGYSAYLLYSRKSPQA